jgi:hypothetical protein
MSAPKKKDEFIQGWTNRVRELLQERNNLNDDALGYLIEKAAAMRDERLKSCIAALIGWGDEERAEIETFCAICLEVLKDVRPSKLQEAARIVEMKALFRSTQLPNHSTTQKEEQHAPL